MLDIGWRWTRHCQGVSRRSLLTAGGLGIMGISLADALRAEAAAASGSPGAGVAARRPASCIFVWLDGGPSQYETFDPKPEARVDVRGPYGAIETNVSGIR